MPSGVSTDTGQVNSVAIKADTTLTFHRLKPGHLLLPGKEYTGKIEILDIQLSNLDTETSIYHLAWLIELFIHSTDPNDEVPVHRWKIFVDAHNGEILEKFDEVRQIALEGQVTAPVKDEPYGISVERGLSHVKVAVSGVGNTYTDENGEVVPLIKRVEALKKTYRNLINNPPQMATGKGVDKTRYGSLIG